MISKITLKIALKYLLRSLVTKIGLSHDSFMIILFDEIRP